MSCIERAPHNKSLYRLLGMQLSNVEQLALCPLAKFGGLKHQVKKQKTKRQQRHRDVDASAGDKHLTVITRGVMFQIPVKLL